MRRHASWIFLFFVSFLPLLDLLHPGLPLTHDGKDHVARIANFYLSLSEGNIIPRWAENLNWGYGHPVMMFLYPLPSYIASIFHATGFSLVDSTKLVFATAYIASILAMYLWAGSVWGKRAGTVAALFYGFAPYRFVDLYVRGAIGEHVSFVFLPIILWGLWRIAFSIQDTRWPSVVVVAGIFGLILSHNALSLMFLSIYILYALYLFFFITKHQNAFFVYTVSLTALGMAIASFFWIPAFFEGKYTLRDIVTAGEFGQRFVPPLWFLWSRWNYGGGNMFSKSLGIAQLSSMPLLLWNYRGLKSQEKIFAAGVICLLLGTLFFMTQSSGWFWQQISLIQKFQFPWRLLSLSVFATSVLGAMAVHSAGKKQTLVSIVVGILAIILTIPMWHAQAYKRFDESLFTSIYAGTTDTGESSPIWSIRFMEHTPKASMEIISGTGNIEVVDRSSIAHEYKVKADSQIQLVENTLYFPGWNVFIDGALVPIEFQNPAYRGLMTFEVTKGNHTVNVLFGKTRMRGVAELVSLASFVLFLIFLGTMSLWTQKKRRLASL